MLYCLARCRPKEFMSFATPITQRDVARACGVHPSTICLALKNSPSIPLPTRRRVQAVAEELGYRPNVAARNLALLRGEKQGGRDVLEFVPGYWSYDANGRAGAVDPR